MAIAFSDVSARDQLDTLNARIGSTGLLRLYTGSAPAISLPATGTLINEFNLPATPFAPASGRSITANAIPTNNAINAGTVGYGEVLDSASNVVMRIPASDMTLSPATVAAGTPQTVTSFVITYS